VRRVFLALLLVTACGGPLDKHELYGEVQDLHALAAEARLLFERDMPARFYTVHRDALAEKVKQAAKKLERGVADPALDADRENAYVLARALEPIVRVGEDPRAVQVIEHQLAAIDTRLAP
jgi:chromosome condensin MukBEF MukE localization factor